ncbi:FHA domain-containing protein [Prosthecobacter sp.]|uniref:FHA domain-containing protein n=1 Tax=Prosthecobacter sp. TaxID=1965333 RepID=UPI001DBD94CE|nr:FHA domain-containing protein [Prosthecobacter sp.]MCB1279278.1 FHA domain-containing protein [Prosthecobacter sp.]
MSQKENIAASWDDMEWGEPEPGPASAPVARPASSFIEITPPQKAAATSAPAAVVDSQLEQERLKIELERVRMESEMARMKAELLEQQRRLEAQQAKVVEVPRTRPLEQDPSAVYPPPASAAVVFNPKSLATLTLSVEGGNDAIVTVKDPFTVGRNKGNDLIIRDLHVSGQHAKFAARRDGVFEIVDLNSSGGTFVNGERIERCALQNGDKIEFATVTAVFRYVAGGQLDSDDDFEGTLVQAKADVARKLASVAKSPLHGLLSVLNSDEQSWVVPVGGQVTIGRQPGNDFVIAEEHISGRHARLAGDGGGKFEIFDIGSSCGTFVNGVQVEHWVLKSGDRIRFGIVDCVFMIIDPFGGANVVERPPLRGGESHLPQVEDSGVGPLPEPKPALRGGQQSPLIRRTGN